MIHMLSLPSRSILHSYRNIWVLHESLTERLSKRFVVDEIVELIFHTDAAILAYLDKSSQQAVEKAKNAVLSFWLSISLYQVLKRVRYPGM